MNDLKDRVVELVCKLMLYPEIEISDLCEKLAFTYFDEYIISRLKYIKKFPYYGYIILINGTKDFEITKEEIDIELKKYGSDMDEDTFEKRMKVISDHSIHVN